MIIEVEYNQSIPENSFMIGIIYLEDPENSTYGL